MFDNRTIKRTLEGGDILYTDGSIDYAQLGRPSREAMAIERNQRQRELFYRDANRIRNENAKRDKIIRLNTECGFDTDVIVSVLGIFAPNTTIATLIAARNGEKLPMPQSPDDDDFLDLTDPK